MEVILAKLTSRYQATVPTKIRRALRLKQKDQIAYEILDDNTVIIRKATPIDVEYLKAVQKTLTEWESEEDEQAYGNL